MTDKNDGGLQGISIVDFDMPFWSMVKFMVKWVIASIPALMILGLLGFLATLIYQSGLSLIR